MQHDADVIASASLRWSAAHFARASVGRDLAARQNDEAPGHGHPCQDIVPFAQRLAAPLGPVRKVVGASHSICALLDHNSAIFTTTLFYSIHKYSFD